MNLNINRKTINTRRNGVNHIVGQGCPNGLETVIEGFTGHGNFLQNAERTRGGEPSPKTSKDAARRRVSRLVGFLFPQRTPRVNIVFKPLPDITAFEFAQIISLGHSVVSVLYSFSDAVLRHLDFGGNRLSANQIQLLEEQGRLKKSDHTVVLFSSLSHSDPRLLNN